MSQILHKNINLPPRQSWKHLARISRTTRIAKYATLSWVKFWVVHRNHKLLVNVRGSSTVYWPFECVLWLTWFWFNVTAVFLCILWLRLSLCLPLWLYVGWPVSSLLMSRSIPRFHAVSFHYNTGYCCVSQTFYSVINKLSISIYVHDKYPVSSVDSHHFAPGYPSHLLQFYFQDQKHSETV